MDSFLPFPTFRGIILVAKRETVDGWIGAHKQRRNAGAEEEFCIGRDGFVTPKFQIPVQNTRHEIQFL